MTQVTDRPQKSTIVRLFSAPWPIRASFWLLDRVGPALGARWAERIWFTLPRPRPRRAAVENLPPSQPFALTVNGHGVVGDRWGVGPAIYLVHGWAGRRDQLTSMVAPLVTRGHSVIAFDAPSHGDSEPGAFGPRSSSIPEFAATLTQVIAQHGPAHAIVAHSMGATATAVALCDGVRTNRLVMLAPMASPLTYARQFADILGFGERTFRRLVARVEQRVGAPMRHFDVPELGRAVAMPPTLILHDRDDVSTPFSDSEAIAAAWSGVRLEVSSGLGHNRMLRDPGIVAQVVEFAAI